MKRMYTRPAMSPTCKPWGTDVSALAWMGRNGLDSLACPALWDALGEVLNVLDAAETLVYLDRDTGEWVS